MPLLTAAFRVTARLRGARAFHPHGVVLAATWHPGPDAARMLGDSPLADNVRGAVVRLSHGVGLPPGAPDLVGVAIKVLDAHGPGGDQDLLFTSSGTGVIGRHLLRPTRKVTGVFSTIAPYELVGGRRHALVAVSAPSASVSYVGVTEGVTPPPFEVRVAGADGPLLGTAEVDVEPPGPSDDRSLAFDPWHTGPELRPVGWINRVRRSTYGASRAGRPRGPAPRRH